MFRITLSPQSTMNLGKRNTSIVVQGKTIIYDGVEYDFGSLPNNSEVQAEEPAIGTIKNVEGVIHVTLHYKYDCAEAELVQSSNIDDYTFEVSSGEVPCPIRWRQAPEFEGFPMVQSEVVESQILEA